MSGLAGRTGVAKEIVDGAARAAWADAWGNAHEERHISVGPGDLMDLAPPTPESVTLEAENFITKVEERNRAYVRPGRDGGWRIPETDEEYSTVIEALYERELHYFDGETSPGRNWDRGDDPSTFGHYIAMEAMGHGVGWWEFRDHDLELPYEEFNEAMYQAVGQVAAIWHDDEEDDLSAAPAKKKTRKYYCEQLFVRGGYESRDGASSIELVDRASGETLWEIHDDWVKNEDYEPPVFFDAEENEYNMPVDSKGEPDEDWFKDEYDNWVGPNGPEYWPPTQVHQFLEDDVEPWLNDHKGLNGYKHQGRWPLYFDDRHIHGENGALDRTAAFLIFRFLTDEDGAPKEWGGPLAEIDCEPFNSTEWSRDMAQQLLARLDAVWARYGIARRQFRHSPIDRPDRQGDLRPRYPHWDDALYEWISRLLGDSRAEGPPPRGLSPDFIAEAERILREADGFIGKMEDMLAPEGEDYEDLHDIVARTLLEMMGWDPF